MPVSRPFLLPRPEPLSVTLSACVGTLRYVALPVCFLHVARCVGGSPTLSCVSEPSPFCPFAWTYSHFLSVPQLMGLGLFPLSGGREQRHGRSRRHRPGGSQPREWQRRVCADANPSLVGENPFPELGRLL